MPLRNGPASVLRQPFIRTIVAAAIIAGAIFAPIPFPFKVPLFAALAIAAVWLETGSLREIGLGRPDSWAKTVLGAAIIAVLVVVLVGQLLSPFIDWVLGIEPDYSSYGPLKGNAEWALQLLAQAFFSAFIAEEIVYRGYLLRTLTQLFGTSRLALGAVVVLGGIVFAVPHAEQGLSGMAIVAAAGMIFAGGYFALGRNLWAIMLAHALVDIYGVGKLYLGLAG